MSRVREALILAVNCGSSSLRLSVYGIGARERLVGTGQVDCIGQQHAGLRLIAGPDEPLRQQLGRVRNHEAAMDVLLQAMHTRMGPMSFDAIGHRIVHGGPAYRAAARVDEFMLAALAEACVFAPLHVPHALETIRCLQGIYADIPHVACFDTGFHRTVLEEAKTFALPRRCADAGIVRYGFHGLSFEFIVEQLASEAGEAAACGKLIIAHLGNGSSMAAVQERRSLDTTMGLTPTGGLVMGTRCGDIDPGVIHFLMVRDGLSPDQVNRLINNESGLLGISGTTSDMRTLLERQHADPLAAQAVSFFCYQARKHLGALTTVLGGLDTLVFTGGIGEHAPEIRRRITDGLGYLGIAIDPHRNERDESIISTPESRVCVRVMKTNEELMICRHACRILQDVHERSNEGK